MKCSRNDKQFRTAEIHGLGRSIGRAGDEAGSGASKHHIIKVLECHAQTSSYVQASEEIWFTSGTDSRRQQKDEVSLGLTSSEKPPPVLSFYYTSITPEI